MRISRGQPRLLPIRRLDRTTITTQLDGDRPMKPMRILHTESSCGWGGQEIRILTESQGLRARGHQVVLACSPKSQIAKEAARFDVPVIELPIEKKKIKGLRALRTLLRSQMFDVVNTHSSTDSWLVALACVGLKDAPAIVRTRHISAPLVRNWATRWVYRRPSRVVTTGEKLRHDVVAAAGVPQHRVVSIPTGMDAQRFVPADQALKSQMRARLGLPADALVVGIVATLRSWKGHRYLLDAAANLVKQQAAALDARQDAHTLPNLQILIVGHGPQWDNLQAQVATLGLHEHVRFVGNQDDVVPYLQTMDIFCLPSYSNEGVPQSLIQAMMVGLPCVTTQAGAISELALHEQTALVVPMEQAGALAQAIVRYTQEPALAASLGAAGRARVLERCSLKAMLDAMETVFKQACSGRQAAA